MFSIYWIWGLGSLSSGVRVTVFSICWISGLEVVGFRLYGLWCLAFVGSWVQRLLGLGFLVYSV